MLKNFARRGPCVREAVDGRGMRIIHRFEKAASSGSDDGMTPEGSR